MAKLKKGDVIDIRLAMDITSGVAQSDGHPRFFRATRTEGETVIPMVVKATKDSGHNLRTGIATGAISAGKATYVRSYVVSEFDLTVGGLPVGKVLEEKPVE